MPRIVEMIRQSRFEELAAYLSNRMELEINLAALESVCRVAPDTMETQQWSDSTWLTWLKNRAPELKHEAKRTKKRKGRKERKERKEPQEPTAKMREVREITPGNSPQEYTLSSQRRKARSSEEHRSLGNDSGPPIAPAGPDAEPEWWRERGQ